MFRPTHFVILFAVVLYASALPAPQGNTPPTRPGRAVEPAGTIDLGKKEPGKADLDTDATDYWGYRYNNYYGPNWNSYEYEPSLWAGRTYGWPHYIY